MARIICIILGILAALCGCSEVQTFVDADFQRAAVIAGAAGDKAGVACYTALEPLAANPPVGLVSKYELFRAGQIIIEDGPCAPLAAGLALHLLNKAPGTP